MHEWFSYYANFSFKSYMNYNLSLQKNVGCRLIFCQAERTARGSVFLVVNRVGISKKVHCLWVWVCVFHYVSVQLMFDIDGFDTSRTILTSDTIQKDLNIELPQIVSGYQLSRKQCWSYIICRYSSHHKTKNCSSGK